MLCSRGVDRHILADAHKHIINVQCKRNEEINVGQVDVIHLLHSLNDGVYQAHRAGVDGKRGTAWQRYILVAHGACHEQEGELVLVAAGENDAVFPLKFCADAVDDRHKCRFSSMRSVETSYRGALGAVPS